MEDRKSKVEYVLKIVLGAIACFLLGVPLLAIGAAMFRKGFDWRVGLPLLAFFLGLGTIVFLILFSSSFSVVKKAESLSLESTEYCAVALRYCRFKANRNRWYAVFFIVFGLLSLGLAIGAEFSFPLGVWNYIGGSAFTVIGLGLYFRGRGERIDLEYISTLESTERLKQLADFLTRYQGDRVGERIREYLDSKNTGRDSV